MWRSLTRGRAKQSQQMTMPAWRQPERVFLVRTTEGHSWCVRSGCRQQRCQAAGGGGCAAGAPAGAGQPGGVRRAGGRILLCQQQGRPPPPGARPAWTSLKQALLFFRVRGSACPPITGLGVPPTAAVKSRMACDIVRKLYELRKYQFSGTVNLNRSYNGRRGRWRRRRATHRSC